MSFVNPVFLWAFVALSIPVVTHLFSFRRYKTVYFPNVLFLQEVKKESDSRTRIKHWLILASRLLALSFLILAFAQPFIQKNIAEIRKGKKAVSVYIDNSFSMQSLYNDVSLLETAKAKAREILNAYEPDDEFQILSNNPNGIQLRFVNRDQANLLVDDIQITPVWKSLSEVEALQRQYLNEVETPNKYRYIISDFQKSFADFDQIKPDTSILTNLIKVNSNLSDNISMDTCWLDKPIQLKDEVVKVFVKITNHGSSTADNGRLALEDESGVKAILNFSLTSNQSITDTIKFTANKAGWNAYTLRVQDYPITFDDTYFIAFESVERIPVIVINGGQPNPYLTALFNQPQRFELTQVNVTQLPYDLLAKNRLIVLNECKNISSGLADALTKAVGDGANALIVPSADIDINTYNNLMSNLLRIQINAWSNSEWQTDKFNWQHLLLRDLFEKTPRQIKMPQGKGYVPLAVTSQSTVQYILNTLSGQPLLLSGKYGKGMIYLSAIPFDKAANNLVTNALFAPIVFKMSLPVANYNPISYTIGSNDNVIVPWVAAGGEHLLKIIGAQQEFLPQQRILGQETQINLSQINQAGIYSIAENTSAPVLRKVALNYNRRESDMQYVSDSELEKAAQQQTVSFITSANNMNLTHRIAEHANGLPLWKYCITFAIAFLVIEILLLKFFR